MLWASVQASPTFADAVSDPRQDVVQLVGHATRLADVRDAARLVQLARDDVVQHAARVTDAEAARGDATDGGGPNDQHTLVVSGLQDDASLLLRHTLRNDRNLAKATRLEAHDDSGDI